MARALETETGEKFCKCSGLNCDENAEHGSHVEISIDKNNWKGRYIISLCRRHNNFNNTDVMELKNNIQCMPIENNTGLSKNIVETIQEVSRFYR